MINFEPFQIINLLQKAKLTGYPPKSGRFVLKWFELDEGRWEPKNLISSALSLSLEEAAEQTWFTEYELLHSSYGLVSQIPHPSGMYLKIWKFPDYLKAV